MIAVIEINDFRRKKALSTNGMNSKMQILFSKQRIKSPK